MPWTFSAFLFPFVFSPCPNPPLLADRLYNITMIRFAAMSEEEKTIKYQINVSGMPWTYSAFLFPFVFSPCPNPPPDRLFRMLVIRQNPPLVAVLLAIIMRVVLRGCQGPRRPRGPIAGHVTP